MKNPEICTKCDCNKIAFQVVPIEDNGDGTGQYFAYWNCSACATVLKALKLNNAYVSNHVPSTDYDKDLEEFQLRFNMKLPECEQSEIEKRIDSWRDFVENHLLKEDTDESKQECNISGGSDTC
jgi:hypothetical protein